LQSLHFQKDIQFSGVEQKISYKHISSDKRINLSKVDKLENENMTIIYTVTRTSRKEKEIKG